jgi:metal-responsive CopG/Arc/MetJ family transcriptional regulator
MRTAVSIPDDVYADVEALVHRLNTSRSELYATALREYLARHDADAVTAALNRVYDTPDTRPDPGVLAAAIQIHQRTEW